MSNVDAADDYEPPVAAKAAEGVEALPLACPNCGKPPKRHSAGQLMRCLDALNEEDDEDERRRKPFEHVAKEPPQLRRPLPPRHTSVIPPPPPKERPRRVPMPPDPSARGGAAFVDEVPKPPPLPEVEPLPTIDLTPTERGFAELPQKTLVTVDGEIDYVELAKAMRKVIEDERDEMIRRGGPIEKQNIELKERLATVLDEAGRWRTKFQRKCAEYNLLEEQNRELTAANRKLRNLAKGQRGNVEKTRIVELKDILEVVEKTKGFTVERAGNGHFIIKKNGVFVTDAASSGQGTKVNMATRVALKKAGVAV